MMIGEQGFRHFAIAPHWLSITSPLPLPESHWSIEAASIVIEMATLRPCPKQEKIMRRQIHLHTDLQVIKYTAKEGQDGGSFANECAIFRVSDRHHVCN